MAVEPAVFVALALALGFKHSYDADHVVAVSNLLTRSRSLRRTSLMSLSWAAGHMITATIVTVILFAFRDYFLQEFLSHLEVAVAVMLVVIGVLGLLIEFGAIHRHVHSHEAEEHEHAHVHLGRLDEHRAMFGIGVIHGLASNDELLVLFVASFGVTALPGLLAGVGLFSGGVVLGMIVFGLGISYPILRWGTARVRRVVTLIASGLSIGYGVLLFMGFGGINPFPSALG
jgi:Na+/melibiose symporter-like transporter